VLTDEMRFLPGKEPFPRRARAAAGLGLLTISRARTIVLVQVEVSITATAFTGVIAASSEPFIRINGQQQYLWRALDQDGDVIDVLVQRRRNQCAAERFFRRLLRRQGVEPLRIITDN
jgi:hypothetical protein